MAFFDFKIHADCSVGEFAVAGHPSPGSYDCVLERGEDLVRPALGQDMKFEEWDSHLRSERIANRPTWRGETDGRMGRDAESSLTSVAFR